MKSLNQVFGLAPQAIQNTVVLKAGRSRRPIEMAPDRLVASHVERHAGPQCPIVPAGLDFYRLFA
ncbi:hypothetical protein [Oricola nitratireducens]|uniref:hypothetical protein n=1 Tax=Oricola nitratireducens TaxID=2775868 RepID=UPI001866B068|nr:hypothetical protein [Oricola nitratireducens]